MDLQDKMRNIEVWGVSAAYIRGLTVYCIPLFMSCNAGMDVVSPQHFMTYMEGCKPMA